MTAFIIAIISGAIGFGIVGFLLGRSIGYSEGVDEVWREAEDYVARRLPEPTDEQLDHDRREFENNRR